MIPVLLFLGTESTQTRASVARAEGKAPHIYDLKMISYESGRCFAIHMHRTCTSTFKQLLRVGVSSGKRVELGEELWRDKFHSEISIFQHKPIYLLFGEKKKDKRKIPSKPRSSLTACAFTCVLNAQQVWTEIFPGDYYTNISEHFGVLVLKDVKTKSLLHLTGAFQKPGLHHHH